MTALAGTWKQDATGWWWENDDKTWPAGTWYWCDGNGDGSFECYYFNANGYCLMNSTTPDGYQVDKNGAWVVNGVIQTKNTADAKTANSGYASALKSSGSTGTTASGTSSGESSDPLRNSKYLGVATTAADYNKISTVVSRLFL